MIELSEFVFETVREDGELALSQGRREKEPSGILVVSPVSEHPALGSLERLKHEYALRDELDRDWAAQPLALVHHEGRLTLVLENPGGEPLHRLVGQPLELSQFFRLAVGLVTALGRLHQRGLIHRDIKPANILVNSGTGDVWLTGFGIASPLPRQRQTAEPPEVIAGTLAYMAPEQTGRMNRSIDSRSDLYSLGVTLYEVLTGVLPFTAVDPMEWVHCHIARQPVPPHECVKEVPAALSAIIMKLLAKTAEARYQTAAGVAADLWRCQMEWHAHRHIELFPLGSQDVSDQLLIPESLYGREREILGLLASFNRVWSSGQPELVLLSGYSGIGKSSVVNELFKVLVPSRGLFGSGKFDQYKRNIPYATLAQAFQNLIRPLLGRSEAELGRCREALSEALGPNGQLMVNLVPELEYVIGKQPLVPDLAPQDAQSRFQMQVRRFLGVFARQEHPLVIFLDDLQWLDTATLDLLEHLVTHSEVRFLLLVGAYRDNEIGPDHPLQRRLEAIDKSEAKVHKIVLEPLGLGDVGRLIADALHCGPARARPLAQLVQAKTGGNPFFAIQFLRALAEEGLLVFDRTTAVWNWDVARIQAKRYTDNVVELMAGKLKRLPAATRGVLQQLACLGNEAGISTVALVQGETEAAVHAALWEAVREGFVFRLENVYTFLHDRVQEAAYALIPEEERPAMHLRISRVLMAQTSMPELEEKIFEIVNQLDRCLALITDQQERVQVAEFYLMAGKRAKISTAYSSALTYLVAGGILLTENSWEQLYPLTFALEFQRAECEFLIGQFEGAEKRLSMLSRRAANLIDRAAVTRLQTELYTALDQSDRAVEAALVYLRYVGIDWPPHPTKDQVRQEYERIWRQLGNRPIESLIDLPPMIDPDCRAILDVLTVVEEPAHYTDENLRCLVVARMANLSLEHGNSDGSCVAYVHLGWFVMPRFGDYEAAFRFGKLALDLVEQRGLERFRARVSQCFGYFVNPWSKHLRKSVDLLRRSFTAAQEAGDLKYAIYGCDRLVTFLLAAGDPLEDVQRETENGLQFARKAKLGYTVDIIVGQLILIRTLRGLTPSFSSFNDAEFEEGRFEQYLEGDPNLVFARCWYWIRKLQARFYAGNYPSALAAASKAKPLVQMRPYAGIDLPDRFFSSKAVGRPGVFEAAEYLFYDALARAAAYQSASCEEQLEYREVLDGNQRELEAWAKNCPENFENRAALVAAEISRLEGRELDAERLYERAIRSARENGFVQNEGIANELAAQFYLARGYETSGFAYLRNARYCYLRWGALGKVQQLDDRYPYLNEDRVTSSSTGTIGTPVGQLDLGTVIKASHAVSGEIVLEKLIETLLAIAVEHAGAERGLLILPHGDEQRIEAEAKTARNKVEVRLQSRMVTAAELPESLFRYVLRTLESVILDDASIRNLFSEDEYVRRRLPRSILCLPLVKQAKLMGVLYLENNLAPRVFTPQRLAMLELLASQAAISLDHAHHAAHLAKANEALRGCLDTLASAPELDDFLGQVMAVITKHLGAVASTLRVLNVEQSTLTQELFFQDGLVMSPAEAGLPESLRSLLLDEQRVATFRSQSSTLVQLRDPHPLIAEGLRLYLLGLGIKALLVIPLTLGGQSNGELSFRFTKERDFNSEELEVARALSIQASLAIQLTRLAKTASESAVLAERNELAGEIHDSLAQFFTGISMQLGAAKEVLKAGSDSIVSYIERAADLAQFGLGEARRSAFSLQPTLIEEAGLIEALQKMVERSNIPGRLRCNFTAIGVPEENLPSAVQQDLLRIAQEAMSNAVRHAKPTVVSVSISCQSPNLTLTVTDNGSGIDPSKTASEGFGFYNMRARAANIGAKLEVQSAPGRGTTIFVFLTTNF